MDRALWLFCLWCSPFSPLICRLSHSEKGSCGVRVVDCPTQSFIFPKIVKRETVTCRLHFFTHNNNLSHHENGGERANKKLIIRGRHKISEKFTILLQQQKIICTEDTIHKNNSFISSIFPVDISE